MYTYTTVKGCTYVGLYGSAYTTITQNTKSCRYVELYGSGLFNFGSYVSLFACFLGFDVPTSSIENVFYYYSCIM